MVVREKLHWLARLYLGRISIDFLLHANKETNKLYNKTHFLNNTYENLKIDKWASVLRTYFSPECACLFVDSHMHMFNFLI
jgi:hypothetical protein